MSFKRNLRQATIDGLTPTYILDPNFQFLDWNTAFENLVAKPFGLRLGMHGMSFVQVLANVDAVIKHSMEVFGSGFNPMCDTEPLLLNTEKYGQIEFRKIATQIFDEHGQKRAWTVSLNISKAQKWDELWSDIGTWISRDTLWGGYSLCSGLITSHPDFQNAVKLIADRLKPHASILELGSTDTRLTQAVLARGGSSWVVQPSQIMLEIVNFKLRESGIDATKATVLRGNPERLDDFTEGSFDTVVSLEGMSRVENPEAVMAHARRLLKPGGTFYFLAFVEGASEAFLKVLHNEEVSSLLVQELDSFENALVSLGKEFRTFSSQAIEKFKVEARLFDGSVVLLSLTR